MLSTPGQAQSEHFVYESDTEPKDGWAIYVDGRWAGIVQRYETNGRRTLLDCRRYYRFAMRDGDGSSVQSGDYFHEESTMEPGLRFMSNEELGQVFRVIAFEGDGGEQFDGAIVVEPFDD